MLAAGLSAGGLLVGLPLMLIGLAGTTAVAVPMLVALGPGRLAALVRACPALGEKLRAAARERMRRM